MSREDRVELSTVNESDELELRRENPLGCTGGGEWNEAKPQLSHQSDSAQLHLDECATVDRGGCFG